jgi:hypothetical protein
VNFSQSIRPGCDGISVTTPGACQVSHRFHAGLADQDVLVAGDADGSDELDGAVLVDV